MESIKAQIVYKDKQCWYRFHNQEVEKIIINILKAKSSENVSIDLDKNKELNSFILPNNSEHQKVRGAHVFYKNEKHRIDYKLIEQNAFLHSEEFNPESGSVLAAVEYDDGSKQWWQNGALNREQRDCFGYLKPTVIFKKNKQDPNVLSYSGACSKNGQISFGNSTELVRSRIGWVLYWYKEGNCHRDEVVKNEIPLAPLLNSIDSMLYACSNNLSQKSNNLSEIFKKIKQIIEFCKESKLKKIVLTNEQWNCVFALSLSTEDKRMFDVIRSCLDEGMIDVGLSLPAIIASDAYVQWLNDGLTTREESVDVTWNDDGSHFSHMNISFNKSKENIEGLIEDGHLIFSLKDYRSAASNESGAGGVAENMQNSVQRKEKLVLPAMLINLDESREWWQGGVRHRTGGLPAIEISKNSEREILLKLINWVIFFGPRVLRVMLGRLEGAINKQSYICYENGNVHRNRLDCNGVFMPALCIGKSERIWQQNGIIHRIDGPSRINESTIVELLMSNIFPKTWNIVLKMKMALQLFVWGIISLILMPFNKKSFIEKFPQEKELWYFNGVKIEKKNHPWWQAQHEKGIINNVLEEFDLKKIKSEKKCTEKTKRL